MKTSAFVGTSLDGYIARTDGSLDFLHAGGGGPNGYEEFIATVDVLVIGRNTFDVVLGFDQWTYGGRSVFVLSSRPLPPLPAGAVVERLEGPPADIVAQLTSRGFTHAYVDGGVTIQQFLQAGVLQHLTVTRVPVLIGSGIALFGSLPHDIALAHVATREYPGGLVQCEYRVDG